MTMTAARLFNKTISLQRNTQVADGQGGWTNGYAQIKTVRGRVRPAKGGEQMAGDQQQPMVTHVAYLKTSSGVQNDDRLVFDGKTLRVQAVKEPSHANRHLEVMCEELEDV